MAEFIGKSYEEAIAQAEKGLGVDKEGLQIELSEEGTPLDAPEYRPWRIQATIIGDKPAQSQDELLVRLQYTPKGVLLSVEKGASDAEINSYIMRRGVRGADLTFAKRQLVSGEAMAMLAPAQQEGPPANDDLVASVSRDEMSATAFIFPGDAQGERLTFERAMDILNNRYNISFGIDIDTVRAMVQARPLRQDTVIAAGSTPVNGQDAVITYHVRLEHTARPRITEGDRVDYRTLDLFESVRAGQVLVSRQPPTPGEDGSTLRGKVLKAKPGRDRQLPRGKGTELSEDKCQLLAAIDGMVAHKEGRLSVMHRFVVQENVDMSTGNIDFVGDVEVRGNIIAGMTVKAEGNVEVHGFVEAATIIAGGSVVLRQGIQGMGKGVVRAGGDVTAKYFERAIIHAHGVVTTDAIYHSEINAVEGVNLVGKRSSLVGGVTRSAKAVTARTIGTFSETPTIVEVGILPEQRSRYNELEASLIRMKTERDKMQLLVRSYGTEKQPDEPPERDALRQRIIEGNRQLYISIAEATVERDRIKVEMESVTGGRVHVTGTIYPGARVVIGSSMYVVETSIDYATFYVVDNEIVFRACEAVE